MKDGHLEEILNHARANVDERSARAFDLAIEKIHELEGPVVDDSDTDDQFEKMEREKARIIGRLRGTVNWDNEPSAKEAWALMIYVCEQCSHKEWIWNARPHVTPFGGIPCPDCPGHMSHNFFGSDKEAPDHEPKAGDMVFIDYPPELALIYAKRRIQQGIDAGYPPPDDKTHEEFAKDLALSDLAEFGGHPPYALRLKS